MAEFLHLDNIKFVCLFPIICKAFGFISYSTDGNKSAVKFSVELVTKHGFNFNRDWTIFWILRLQLRHYIRLSNNFFHELAFSWGALSSCSIVFQTAFIQRNWKCSTLLPKYWLKILETIKKIQLQADIPTECSNKISIFTEILAVKKQELYWSIYLNSNFILIIIIAHKIVGWILLFFFSKSIKNNFSAHLQPFPNKMRQSDRDLCKYFRTLQSAITPNYYLLFLPWTQFNLDIHYGAKLTTNVTELKRFISKSLQIFHSLLGFYSYY